MKTWRAASLLGLLAGVGLVAMVWMADKPGPEAETPMATPAGQAAVAPKDTDASNAGKQMARDGADAKRICRDLVFEGARAVLCAVDPATHEIRLAYRDAAGEPLGSVARAVEQLALGPQRFGRLVLAMNAGMYHADLSPVGLYVEDSIEIAPLITEDGFGNFFLKPNGVFFVGRDGRAGAMETLAYQAAGIDPAFATQSGPMLLIGGDIHPRFLPDGTSRHIRNGVGVRADGEIVLAITRDPVSLGAFARLFRDAADCPDALFFDGAVSSLAFGDRMEIDSGDNAGPIVVVFERLDGPPA